jgi:predicted phosphodiesterase
MRILVYSDLHLESSPFKPPEIYPEVVILAGDIDNGTKGISWALNYFKNIPIIYVPGNHEYYNHIFPTNTHEMQQACLNTNLQVLDLNSCIFKNVEFFGATLWTDFGLFGDAAQARKIAGEKMSDYRCIKHAQGLITPEIISEYHYKSLNWLSLALKQSNAKYKVVITHHAPSKKSVTDDFLARDVAAGYVNQLDHFFQEHHIDLWIHGHTHQKIDYNIGNTRIVSNPRGHRGSKHQLRFNPEEIVILDTN